MEVLGTWTKDEEGFMDFEPADLQRYYQAITDSYYRTYNHYLGGLDDEEEAHYKALSEGYEMITDYKLVDGQNEFVTTFITPAYTLDMWYTMDEETSKKVYDKGFIRITKK